MQSYSNGYKNMLENLTNVLFRRQSVDFPSSEMTALDSTAAMNMWRHGS